MNTKLKKGDITIQEVLTLSKAVYKGQVDNKLMREKKDIIGGKIIGRRGLIYNKQTKQWEQESREVRFDFIVRSIPISYQKTDDVKVHKYPVTFLLKDFDKGLKSPFRWRTGGLKKWKNTKPAKRNISEGKDEKEKQKIREEKAENSRKNKEIINKNIRNGLQGNFIFSLMWVLKQYDLLFGPLTCKNVKPVVTNPKLIPYFDKTALYVVLRILPRLLKNPKVGQAFSR
jgi:hypothetical protein